MLRSPEKSSLTKGDCGGQYNNGETLFSTSKRFYLKSPLSCLISSIGVFPSLRCIMQKGEAACSFHCIVPQCYRLARLDSRISTPRAFSSN